MSDMYVTDTMALVLRLEKRRLSPKVKAIFVESEAGNVGIFIPVIVLAEIGYLSERGKIEATLKNVKDYCQKYSSIHVEPMTETIIYQSFAIDDIPELHDRLIAGTASLKGIRLITNDPKMIASNAVSTIWS